MGVKELASRVDTGKELCNPCTGMAPSIRLTGFGSNSGQWSIEERKQLGHEASSTVAEKRHPWVQILNVLLTHWLAAFR